MKCLTAPIDPLDNTTTSIRPHLGSGICAPGIKVGKRPRECVPFFSCC